MEIFFPQAWCSKLLVHWPFMHIHQDNARTLSKTQYTWTGQCVKRGTFIYILSMFFIFEKRTCFSPHLFIHALFISMQIPDNEQILTWKTSGKPRVNQGKQNSGIQGVFFLHKPTVLIIAAFIYFFKKRTNNIIGKAFP